MVDSLPPQNLAAEKSVLGCAMFDESGADRMLAVLKAEHFYCESHQILFRIISDQRRRGLRPDSVTMLDGYASALGLPINEAALELAEILNTVPHSETVDHYARIVLEKFQARMAVNALRTSLAKLTDPAALTVEILGDVSDAIQTAIADGISDAPQTAAEAMADALTTEEVVKIPIGFTDLDAKCGGLAPKTMTVVGARPSVGKTALVLEMLRRLSMFGVAVLLFSVEMSRRSIVMRLGSMQLGLPFSNIRDGRLGADDRNSLEAMPRSDWISRLHIDEEARTVEEMTSIVRLYVRRFGVKVVAVDYLQLIPPSNARQPREQQVSDISRKLKQMAKAANVAVVVLAQLNREIEKRDQKKPKLSDLRESGSIEQDADQVWLLWRPNKDTDSTDDHGELIVAKNRNGETGSVMLSWHGPTMTYGDFRDQAYMAAAEGFAEVPF